MKREKMVGFFSGSLTKVLFNRLLDDKQALCQFLDSNGQNLLHLLSKNQLKVEGISDEDTIAKLSPFFNVLDVKNFEDKSVVEMAIENENWVLATMIFRIYQTTGKHLNKEFTHSMTFVLHDLATRELKKLKHIGYYLDFVDKILSIDDLNKKDTLGRRPLELSIIFRNDMFIKVFLSKVIKMEMDAYLIDGFNELIDYAVYFKKEDVLSMLIQINPSIINDKNLLHLDFYRPDFFRFLLDEYYDSIDFSLKNKNGISIVSFFQSSERSDLYKILKTLKHV